MPERRVTAVQTRVVFQRAHGCCEYCRSQARFALQSFSNEHIVPRSAGGESELNNLALACQGCNNHKIYTYRGGRSRQWRHRPLVPPARRTVERSFRLERRLHANHWVEPNRASHRRSSAAEPLALTELAASALSSRGAPTSRKPNVDRGGIPLGCFDFRIRPSIHHPQPIKPLRVGAEIRVGD
jgi:5-methylcytosine-specific restriction endonuclease McrA